MSNSAFFPLRKFNIFSLSNFAQETFLFHSPVNKHDKVYIIVMVVGKAWFVLLGICFDMFIWLYSIDIYHFCFGGFLGMIVSFLFKILFSAYTSFPQFSRKFCNVENSGLYYNETIWCCKTQSVFWRTCDSSDMCVYLKLYPTLYKSDIGKHNYKCLILTKFNVEAPFTGQDNDKVIPEKGILMAHNWQKWKSILLTCPWHKIYRVEAVGLKSSNYTLKNYVFVWICEIWGNFMKNWYFVNNCLIKV